MPHEPIERHIQAWVGFRGTQFCNEIVLFVRSIQNARAYSRAHRYVYRNVNKIFVLLEMANQKVYRYVVSCAICFYRLPKMKCRDCDYVVFSTSKAICWLYPTPHLLRWWSLWISGNLPCELVAQMSFSDKCKCTR